jgi:hypothetical protein
VPAGLGDVAVVEHEPAHLGQRLGLPLGCAALVILDARRCHGVDERGDRVVERSVVEAALQRSAWAAAVRQQVQLVDLRRWALVGFGSVGVEFFDQLGAPGLQLARRVLGGLLRKRGLGAGPDRRGQSPRGGRVEQFRDDLDVA